MQVLHPPYHWIGVALVASAALLTVSTVYGQHNDASSMFDGRPAMAGANGGTGAMAGPPQGGIGVQGSENSGLALRAPKGLRDVPPGGKIDPASDAVAVNHAVKDNKDVTPKDSSFAPEQRSARKRVARAARNVVNQKRHGVASIQ